MSDVIHSGEFNRHLEIFEDVLKNQDTGERTKKTVPDSKGKVWMKREDISGNEDADDGQIVATSKVRFYSRYSLVLLNQAPKYYIRDVDGDYQIESVQIFGTKRNRYLEYETEKRG